MPDLIIRHRKENRKKCSLSGLEKDSRFEFITYPFKTDCLPQLCSYLLLAVDAPPLSRADAHYKLLLIDSTWRYAPRIYKQLPPGYCMRSLPPQWQTAYPRRQEVSQGLASIEALFAAYVILGHPTEGLLTHYLWKEAFLSKNHALVIDSLR